MRELSRKELLKYRDGGFMTVKELKDFIGRHHISDDAIIAIERVEDSYYDKPDGKGWGVYCKEAEWSGRMKAHNEDIDSGKYLDKEQYPHIKENDTFLKKYTEEEITAERVQYHPAWGCVKYRDEDNDILFIDLHY